MSQRFKYRNFEIWAEQMFRVPEHLCGLWRPWMRELPDGKKRELCIIGNNEADALKTARQCVDYDYRVKTWEFLNERKYNAMKDGLIEEFK